MKSTSELRLGEDVSFVSDIRLRMIFKLSIPKLAGAQVWQENLYIKDEIIFNI